MPKIKTSVSIERATLRRLKAEAKRNRRSVSQLVDLWIEEKLPRNGKRQQPPAGLADALPAQGDHSELVPV